MPHWIICQECNQHLRCIMNKKQYKNTLQWYDNIITSVKIESANGRIPLTPMYRGGEDGNGEKCPPGSISPTVPCHCLTSPFSIQPLTNPANRESMTVKNWAAWSKTRCWGSIHLVPILPPKPCIPYKPKNLQITQNFDGKYNNQRRNKQRMFKISCFIKICTRDNERSKIYFQQLSCVPNDSNYILYKVFNIDYSVGSLFDLTFRFHLSHNVLKNSTLFLL